jgi:hypothetical protein
MRVTVIKEDGVIGVDGVYRDVDLSEMAPAIRVVQWNDAAGHIEYEDGVTANMVISSIDDVQAYIDLWTAAEPVIVPPTAAEMIAAAHSRINAAYSAAVGEITAGYPQAEIDSWGKQEEEARAWLLDSDSPTPWIDGAAQARAIAKADLIALIIGNADALAPIHGALTGKRQNLRDAIDALGASPTQEQLDAVVW